MNTVTGDKAVITSFSDFIRGASSQEKHRVFSQIVANANHEQQQMLAKAKQLNEQAQDAC